ncbi:50S ribosomal protein L7ae [archaeon]|nr:MAG: 50S ribosomal protein L7ae [archaeon]
MPKAYVKFSVPKELSNKVLQALEAAKNSGKLRIGINETTKAIEKSQAQLVIIAEDIEPEEIAMHLPVLCEEKKIAYVYVPSKLELGRAAGIDVQSAAIAVVDAGEAKDSVSELVKTINQMKK